MNEEATLRIISADSHVVEPHDLWTTRLSDGPWAHLAPNMQGDANSGYTFHVDGLPPFPVGLAGAAGRPSESLDTKGEMRAGGYDVEARLVDMDADGIEAEVLYPSVGMHVAMTPDPEYQLACMRAYNDWLIEFCDGGQGRLAGLALIPAVDVATSVKEVERTHAAGLRGALVPAVPATGHYAEERFDPLWAALAERHWPVSFHVLTGGGNGDPTLGTRIPITGLMSPIHHMQATLAILIFSGIFDRHPELRVVSAEHDAGWVAHFGYRYDQMFERHHNWLGAGIKLDRNPSEYLMSNCWYTFQKDPIAVETRERVGTSQLLWASDYPHSDSTWPHSRQVIERDFKGVPHTDLAAIVGGNAATLYGLD
ncbi:amidohydrolase [Myxococcota bacterium]|nr:amidohydrolase [Myxococcota bacterium]